YREVRLQTAAIPIRLDGNLAVEGERIRTRGQRGVVAVQLNPRSQLAVGEAHTQVAMHRNLASEPDDDPDEIVCRARGHEVDDVNSSAFTGSIGFEDQSLLFVVLIDVVHLRRGAQQPISMLVVSQQLGEAGIRIDTWQAQPINRATTRDQRYRRRVADDAVLF